MLIQKTFYKIVFLMLAVHLIYLPGCNREEIVVQAGDRSLGQAGLKLTYNGKPFSGVLQASMPAMQHQIRESYRNGLQHGKAEEIRGTKQLAMRNYYKGMKHGVHRTWYPDGKPRTYQKFKMSVNTGERWVWHSNGKPAEYLKYNDQGRAIVHKRWRSTGQIYSNVVILNGEAFGLPGSKVCDPVGQERGKKIQ